MERRYDLTTSDDIQSYLQTHGYPTCTTVERLAEGWSGFVYRARIGEGNDREHHFSEATQLRQTSL